MRAAQYLLLHSTQVFMYEGQPAFFVFQNPEVTILNHPYINTLAVQEEAYTLPDIFTGHNILACSPSPPQRSTTLFCMGCQVLLLKPTWTCVCIPDFYSHWSYTGSKAVYSFGLVGSTPTRFQENVPKPPIRAFMLLLEPKERWHTVFTAHVALNSPVLWGRGRQHDCSPLIMACIFKMFKSLQPFCSIQCILTINCSRMQAKTVGKILILSLHSKNKNEKIQAAFNMINV